MSRKGKWFRFIKKTAKHVANFEGEIIIIILSITRAIKVQKIFYFNYPSATVW